MAQFVGALIFIMVSCVLCGGSLGYLLGMNEGFKQGRDSWKKQHPGLDS